MNERKSRSKVGDRESASAPRPSSAGSHISTKDSGKLVPKARPGDPELCGMNEAGKPLPAGLSGMLGPSKADTRPPDEIERRVGEISARVSERGANRSGTAAGDLTKGRRMRTFQSARRKVDAEG